MRLRPAIVILLFLVAPAVSAANDGEPVPASAIDMGEVVTATPAGTPLLNLTLDQAAAIAVEGSHKVAAQRETAGAANESAASAATKRFPMIGITAQTQVLSKIGEVIPAVGAPIQIGDHYNWSVGPVLSWTAWDAGAIAKNAKSLKRTADAERFATEASKRDALLSSRMGYFAVQLASEQLRLVADALAVARLQYRDVSNRASAGAASRLDLVTAHQEVMDRERDELDAQAELAVQVRQLVAILDLPQRVEPTAPADVRTAKMLAGMPIRPDLLLDLDTLADALAAMRPRATGTAPLEKHPAIQSARERTDAARTAWEAAKANHWPKVTVQGSSTFQYPNFAQLETVQQNQVTFGLSLPVLDWGMISKDARSQRHKANAALEQLRQTETQLAQDLGGARDQASILERQRATVAAAARDAVEAAKLIYDAYLAGEVIFLEVQRANLKALQAKVDAARTDAQLLGQFARLENLITNQGTETAP